MIDRETLEKREYEYLSEYACKAAESRGRQRAEEKCGVRTDFQRDRDRIIHSKSFRRLMHKTQVFLAPEGDHFRTRLTHTLEVAQIARTIARALALNEDLTEAISLGHDLGHTPFGHNGEKILNEIYPKGFRHNEQSLRVVEVLEGENGSGMNLTYEVRDGIRNHTGNIVPVTLEGQIVKTADRIAYINHDIDDAIRSGVITENDLPAACVDRLGHDHRSRINTLVMDMVTSSDGNPEISMSDEAREQMDILRSYMFKHVYLNSEVKAASDISKVEQIIKGLYNYYTAHPEQLPAEIYAMRDRYPTDELAKDYIAGMTDRFAVTAYERL